MHLKLITSLLLASFLSGIPTEFKLIREKALPKVSNFTVDELEQCYYISNDILYKYIPTQDRTYNYSDKQYGSPAYISTLNSMRLLLLFPDLALLQVLDNKLSLQTTIELRKFGLMLPKLCANSYNNCYWIYDASDFQLKRFDGNFKLINSSGNLSQLIGKDIQPTYLVEYGNNIFLSDPGIGILLLDVFGNFQKILPLKDAESFQVFNKLVIGLSSADSTDERKMRIYNMQSLQEEDFPLPEGKMSKIRFARLTSQKLLLVSRDSLFIYAYQ